MHHSLSSAFQVLGLQKYITVADLSNFHCDKIFTKKINSSVCFKCELASCMFMFLWQKSTTVNTILLWTIHNPSGNSDPLSDVSSQPSSLWQPLWALVLLETYMFSLQLLCLISHSGFKVHHFCSKCQNLLPWGKVMFLHHVVSIHWLVNRFWNCLHPPTICD